MEYPLIYIILPVYNWWEFFFQQLYTIKSQIYDNWHLIIVNDGSTDNTISELQNFIDRYKLTNKVTIISQKNTWQYAACWAWLEKVKELCKWQYEWKYIAYCDADDLWTNNKLIDQFNFMEHNPDCDLSYHDCWLINENNEIIWPSSLHYFSNLGKRINAQKFFEICMWQCAISTTMIFKAKRIDEILPVYPKFSQDWRIMLIISGQNWKIKKIDKKYGYYRRSYKSSLITKKRTMKYVDWLKNYLDTLQFLTSRIRHSNNKTLEYIIKYNKFNISIIEQKKTLYYKFIVTCIKFPKIIFYIAKSALLSQKDFIHFLGEYKKLLNLKN